MVLKKGLFFIFKYMASLFNANVLGDLFIYLGVILSEFLNVTSRSEESHLTYFFGAKIAGGAGNTKAEVPLDQKIADVWPV